MKVGPLTPDKVPEEFRFAFDYYSQILSSMKGGRKTRTILRMCVRCARIDRVGIENIRQSIKAESFTCLCKKCNVDRWAELLSGPKNTGEAHRLWKGGRHESKDGYVFIMVKDHPCADKSGYVLENRLIMEAMIGRYLTKEETVHHKNGIRNDNRPENLELYSGRHGKGQSILEMLEFCEQYIAEYGPLKELLLKGE